MGHEKIPWETKLALLVEYKEKYGTAMVPTRYIDPKTEFRLGGWVHHLRQTRSKLTPAQFQILDKMGFVWNASKEWPWETKLASLQRFYQIHSHFRVPRLYVDEASGFKLGQWVPSMRRKNACIKPSRRRDLEAIGFFGPDYVSPLDNVAGSTDTTATEEDDEDLLSPTVGGGSGPSSAEEQIYLEPAEDGTYSALPLAGGSPTDIVGSGGGVVDGIAEGLATMRQPLESLKAASSAPLVDDSVQIYEL